MSHLPASKKETAPPPYILRRDAMCDRGLPLLSGIELKVWYVYEKHAGQDGLAWPGPNRIAKMIGHKDARSVKRARRALVRKGFLVEVTAGGGVTSNGYGRTTRYRVTVPSRVAELSPIRKGVKSTTVTGVNSGAKGGQIDPDIGVEDTPLTVKEQLMERTNGTSDDDGDGKTIFPEDTRIQANERALAAIGIIGKRVTEIASLPWLVEPTIDRCWKQINELKAQGGQYSRTVSRPTGLLISMLKDDVSEEARKADYAAFVAMLRDRNDRDAKRTEEERKKNAKAEEIKRSAIAGYDAEKEAVEETYREMEKAFTLAKVNPESVIQKILEAELAAEGYPTPFYARPIDDRAKKWLVGRAYHAGTYDAEEWYPKPPPKIEAFLAEIQKLIKLDPNWDDALNDFPEIPGDDDLTQFDAYAFDLARKFLKGDGFNPDVLTPNMCEKWREEVLFLAIKQYRSQSVAGEVKP